MAGPTELLTALNEKLQALPELFATALAGRNGQEALDRAPSPPRSAGPAVPSVASRTAALPGGDAASSSASPSQAAGQLPSVIGSPSLAGMADADKPAVDWRAATGRQSVPSVATEGGGYDWGGIFENMDRQSASKGSGEGTLREVCDLLEEILDAMKGAGPDKSILSDGSVTRGPEQKQFDWKFTELDMEPVVSPSVFVGTRR